MKIYLIRHARADWSPGEDRSLSAEGGWKAQELADQLSVHPIEAVYSSPYRRAIQTVQPLADRLGLEVRIERGFRERTLGHFAGVSFEEAVRQTWLDFNFAFPGGESNTQAQQRAVRALEELLVVERASPVAVSTHGNLLVLILNHYDPEVGYEFWSGLRMPDVIELEVRHNRVHSWQKCALV